MSRIHVLERTSEQNYRIVVHAPMPNGNNSAGVAWKTAYLLFAAPQTVMKIGAGLGQIDQAEADQVAAGDVLEVDFQWTDNPALNNAQRLADLDAQATARVQNVQDDMRLKLRYFGFERA